MLPRSMPIKISHLALVLVLVLTGACSSNPITYKSAYDHHADFADLQTFAWREPNEHNENSATYIANPFVDERIKNHIELELQEKNYQKVDPADADFLVNYTVVTGNKIDMRDYNLYTGYSSRYVGGYYGSVYQVTPQYQSGSEYSIHEEGTFVLDFTESHDDSLLWRGTAEGRMSKQQLTPEGLDERIEMVVGEVLAGFPPPA